MRSTTVSSRGKSSSDAPAWVSDETVYSRLIKLTTDRLQRLVTLAG